jgi:hypothetical protein
VGEPAGGRDLLSGRHVPESGGPGDEPGKRNGFAEPESSAGQQPPFGTKPRPTLTNWDRCYDFLNIFAEFFGEKNRRFFTQNEAKSCKIVIITLVFEKNAIFFAENCDHNIDPRNFKSPSNLPRPL